MKTIFSCKLFIDTNYRDLIEEALYYKDNPLIYIPDKDTEDFDFYALHEIKDHSIVWINNLYCTRLYCAKKKRILNKKELYFAVVSEYSLSEDDMHCLILHDYCLAKPKNIEIYTISGDSNIKKINENVLIYL